MSRSFMSQLVRNYYETPSVAERYAVERGLLPAEEHLIRYLSGRLENNPILDIGVGPGRTTPFLKAKTPHYVQTTSEHCLPLWACTWGSSKHRCATFIRDNRVY
jgi:hypothetical protein